MPGDLAIPNALPPRQPHFCIPSARCIIIGHDSRYFRRTPTGAPMHHTSRVLYRVPDVLGTQIDGMHRHVSAGDEVILERLLFTSVGTRPIRRHAHLATRAMPFDAVQSPTLVAPLVDLKHKSPGSTVPNGRDSKICNEHASTRHSRIDTKAGLEFQCQKPTSYTLN